MSWLVEQQLCRCEGREHLAPTGGMALGRCRKLWPRPMDLATPHLLCLPGMVRWRAGSGAGENVPPPRHLHQGPETCLQSQLDKCFSVKETQGVTLSICSPLHSATEKRLASLLQGGGQSPLMDSGTLRREPGQKACVPISKDGSAPTASGAFYVPAECRQSAHFFKNELPSSWSALATGT